MVVGGVEVPELFWDDREFWAGGGDIIVGLLAPLLYDISSAVVLSNDWDSWVSFGWL